MKNVFLIKNVSIALLALLSISFLAKAGSPMHTKSLLPQNFCSIHGAEWSFRENKGQVMDENHKPLNNILFYGIEGGVNIYCQPGMIGFVFTRTENDTRVSEATGEPKFNTGLPFEKDQPGHSKIFAKRAELEFLNANLNAEISATDRQRFYENYYTTGDANHGITNVRTYKTIIYKNIYPNIDLVLHAKANGMKYEFLGHPGGKVADIQMKWNGLNTIEELENGGINYTVSAAADPAAGMKMHLFLTRAVMNNLQRPMKSRHHLFTKKTISPLKAEIMIKPEPLSSILTLRGRHITVLVRKWVME